MKDKFIMQLTSDAYLIKLYQITDQYKQRTSDDISNDRSQIVFTDMEVFKNLTALYNKHARDLKLSYDCKKRRVIQFCDKNGITKTCSLVNKVDDFIPQGGAIPILKQNGDF